jgi:hypothetical protein
MDSNNTTATELNKIAEEVESVDSSKVSSDATVKKAALIEAGNRVVCVNPVQGIYKGRCYIADQYLEPGVLVVTELDGAPVGAFRANRFCLDNNEY